MAPIDTQQVSCYQGDSQAGRQHSCFLPNTIFGVIRVCQKIKALSEEQRMVLLRPGPNHPKKFLDTQGYDYRQVPASYQLKTSFQLVQEFLKDYFLTLPKNNRPH